jgi:hypothetical protein
MKLKAFANNVRSAGILPARGTKTCANNVWSAGILPARETKSFANIMVLHDEQGEQDVGRARTDRAAKYREAGGR